LSSLGLGLRQGKGRGRRGGWWRAPPALWGVIYRLTGRLTEVEALDYVRVERAIAVGDLMNVRFGPLCGLKADISRGPSCARS
jgi:biotin-(acetyl-CoA carboxylase) ligase